MGNFISDDDKKMLNQCQENSCVFCKIVKKRSGTIIYEDSDVIAFYDINPKAPVHFLVIPKKHVDMIQHLTPKDSKLLGKLLYTAKIIAQEIPELKNGYRLVMNNGVNARQEIYHIHLHVVGGTKLAHPKHIRNSSKKSKSDLSVQ